MRVIAIDILVALGVLAELLAVLGVLVMRSVYDRLHYAAASTAVGPFLILAAILIGEGGTSQSAEAIAAVGFLFLANPLLVHATARAARRIDFGDARARPEEERQR